MHLFLFSMHMYAHIYIHRSLLQFSVPNVIVSLKMEHSWAQCLFPLQFILDSTFSVSSCFPHLHTPSLQSGMNLPSTSWTLPWGNHCFRYFNWVSLCQRKKKKRKNLTTHKLRVMFYLVGRFRISSLGDSISRDPERTVPSKQGRSQVI